MINRSTTQIIRPQMLMRMLGVSRSTLWRWEQQGLLPPKVTLSERVVGWRYTEIQSWLEARTKTINKNLMYEQKND